MPSTLSILNNLSKNDVRAAPYPHIDSANRMDGDIYSQMQSTFPTGESVARTLKSSMASIGSNKGFGLSGQRILDAKALPEPWLSFFEYHLSKAFYLEVLSVFRDHIVATHPDIDDAVGQPLEEFTVSPRTSKQDADLKVDCQLWFNTPPTVLSTVRGIHVDKPTRLYSALLYFRNEADDSAGGDLGIFSWNGERRLNESCHVTDNRLVQHVKTVAYAPNRLIFFVNSPDALHGVSPRSPTPHTRQFVNFLAEVNAPLFKTGGPC